MSPNDEAHVFGRQLYLQWTALWNLDLDLASDILAPQFVLRYAQPGTEAMDRATVPVDLVNIVRNWHDKRRNIRFSAVGEAVVDLFADAQSFTGLVAQPYEVSFEIAGSGRVSCGGTDTLRVVRGRISEVWSVSSGPQGRCFYRDVTP